LALAKKYLNSNQESIWQYVFPSHSLLPDEQDCIIRRFQIIKIGLQKAVKTAVQKAVFPKKVSCHNFRYCFAPHFAEGWILHSALAVLGRFPHHLGTSRAQRFENFHEIHAHTQTRYQVSEEPI
jgi:integrase